MKKQTDPDKPAAAPDFASLPPPESAPDSADARESFTPVPLRPRHDGWTPAKQIAFIEALADCACVEEACRRVGMSRQTAYALRRRPCGRPFRDAWEAAIDYGLHQLEQAVIGRATNGVPRPIFYKGEQVGEYREYDERLAVFLLRTRRGPRYGAWLDRQPSPIDPEIPFAHDESALRLEFHLGEIAESGDYGDDDDEPDRSAADDASPRA